MCAKKHVAPPSEQSWPCSSLTPTAGNVLPNLVAEARTDARLPEASEADERGPAEPLGLCLAFPGLHYATQ